MCEINFDGNFRREFRKKSQGQIFSMLTVFSFNNVFFEGVGPDGHIAYNEPGSSLTSRTRVIKASSGNKKALTIGIATILDAKEVCWIFQFYILERLCYCACVVGNRMLL